MRKGHLNKFIILFLIVISSTCLPHRVVSQQGEPLPTVKFRAILESKEIFDGGCFNMAFAILVDDKNQLRIQFKDAGKELLKILGQFEKLDASFYSFHIDSLYGKQYFDPLGTYTRYDVWKGMVCPWRSGEFKVPSYQFSLEKLDSSSTSPLPLKSLFRRVKVKPLEASIRKKVHSNNDMKMVGEFFFDEDTIRGTYTINEPVKYNFTISGTGNGFPISFNLPDDSDIDVIVDDIQYSDTVINDRINFRKRFDLTLVPQVSGQIDLGNVFQWTYLSPEEESIKTIRSHQQLSVSNSTEPIRDRPEVSSPQLLICLDISESMQVQDYLPSRMTTAADMTKELLNKFPQAEVIGFSGSIHKIQNLDLGDSLFFLADKRGTALGDMVWQSVERLKHFSGIKKVILIGDGDRTSGSFHEKRASQYAKKEGIVFYTIGIGKRGKVPFGKDENGNTNYVENTYNDNSLKTIAEVTGGSFYYLDNVAGMQQLIESILSNMN